MILQQHKDSIKNWFLKLFCGQYDKEYFEYLFKISETHVKIGLPSHYVNTAFSFVREFLVEMLLQNNKEEYLFAMHKIVDINLDILSLSYSQEDQEQLINDVVLIKNAISYNSIIPFVQPIMYTSDETINKFESLMRIPDESGNIIYPIYPIIQTSKKIHLYTELMRQMILKTFDVFRDIEYSFSINIGYEDISDAQFSGFLTTCLETFPNPNRIIFEILETDIITDFDVVLSFIKHIKHFGCQIAIDDFGSGYSSIENILKLKPDYIKIDGSLIKELDTSIESYTVVKSIITMAKELNSKTVAEFVHNKHIYQILKTLEVDYLQGYYIGIPFPASELLNR
jgi:EAL domain-containing protein (putative c-di-GMP-specific phosphodiesterase class I)